MNRSQKKSAMLLGSIAGAILNLFGRSNKSQEIRKQDFTTSTQKMGIRFNKKIRNTFRTKWLKKHK